MTDILFTPIRLNELEVLIQNSVERGMKNNQLKQVEPSGQTDQWFDLPGLCEYIPGGIAKATVYAWVHDGRIPYHKRKGLKKLGFLKSEIDEWLKEGRRKTVSELADEADQYLVKKKEGVSYE